MATDYFGIDEAELIYADMLDIVGADADKIISDKCEEINGQRRGKV